MQIKVVTSLLFSAIFSGLATAVPANVPYQDCVEIGNITAAQVSQFAPGTSMCTESNTECSTAETAATALNDAFYAYSLTTLCQKAGLIAYMAYESADFAYNINIYPPPGRSGQGTKCMLMFPHLYNFALSFPELKPQVLNLSPPEAQTAGVTFSNYESLFPDDTCNQIRELVLPDKYAFKCAAWFVTSYLEVTCDKTTLNNGMDGFVQTMESPCFGVDVTPDRQSKYCTTMMALLPSYMDSPPGC